MSDEYKRVLNEWAFNMLPSYLNAVKVVDVSFSHYSREEGGCPSCYGGITTTMDVTITYEDDQGNRLNYSSNDNSMCSFESDLGTVLSQLFSIAEREES